ncbi:FecR domain-containing protein [Chitinophaga filiformis]|uniref:FecR family protein n=1 Tax=Chitinophaga filiformis TaxID=104663 RepID=UPI001F3A3C45|nr:FecR domain-containing protein [Chitinophaga filiformis]MCF6401509.1 FecR domain-containing protein [Chitinophaga filiformis]
MDYSAYDTADFVCDDSFVAWVKEGRDNAYWEQVITQYPDKQEAMSQAKAIILAAAQLPVFQLKEQDQLKMWNEISNQMDITGTTPVKKSRFIYWYWAAAAVCIMAGAALWWMRPGREPAAVYTRLLHEAKLDGNKRVEEVNEEKGPRTVRLPDGSSVVLQPGARISYPVCAGGNCKREVYLSGAAFFEVSRNTLQPFVVYANEMVINVLGTSFHVKAYDQDSLVEVYVKTGKVALSVQPLGSKVVSNVSANQQAILQRNTLAVSVQLPEHHQTDPKAPAAITHSFVFNDAPVDSVMNTIENAYGVHIRYDKALLADCRLTASLTDEPLYEKIRLICRALEAECIIEGNDITLLAKGCHRY